MRQILVRWRSVFTLLIDVGDCKSCPQFIPTLFPCLYNVTLSSTHKEVESVSLLLKVGRLPVVGHASRILEGRVCQLQPGTPETPQAFSLSHNPAIAVLTSPARLPGDGRHMT